jgi:phytoene desaturase
LVPAGRHSYYVLFPTPHLAHRDALDWSAGSGLRERYREHVGAALAARGYTGLAEPGPVEMVTTPLEWSARDMAGGTPFASAHVFRQTGPFRPRNLWGENVVFAGSGTTPGVGVPMVLMSGRLAAERVLGPQRRRQAGLAGTNAHGYGRMPT